MARILILDDNEIVFGAPENYLVDPRDYRMDDVTQVAHPDLFWQEFDAGGWDEVWLDHDLGLTTTGRDVTKRMAELGHDGQSFPMLIVITSMNGVAGDAMEGDLRRYTDATVQRCPISFLSPYGVMRGFNIPYDEILRNPPKGVLHSPEG